MPFFLLFYSFFFIWIPTFIYPPLHRVLRKKEVYTIAIILAIVPIVLSVILLFQGGLTPLEKAHTLISLSPLTFLLLYKKINERSMKKYNRPLYLVSKYGQDRETKESTWIEGLFQFLLVFIPFFWGVIGSWIFDR